MAEVQVIFAWGMLLILSWVLAGILVLIGLIGKNIAVRSAGFVVLGLTAFASPVAFYLHEIGNSWEPRPTDILILGVLAFLGGISLASGALTCGKSSKQGMS